MFHAQDKNFDLIKVNKEDVLEKIKGKFVIVLDFDGVISSPYKLKTEYLNKLGYTLKEEESSRENCIRHGVDIKDYDDASIKAYTEDPEVLPSENGVSEGIEKLNALKKISIVILTNKYDYMVSHVGKFLKFNKIRVDWIVNTENEGKAKYLGYLSPKFFIEDTPREIMGALNNDEVKDCLFVIYRNVQNKNWKMPNQGNIIESDDWGKLAGTVIGEYRKFEENIVIP